MSSGQSCCWLFGFCQCPSPNSFTNQPVVAFWFRDQQQVKHALNLNTSEKPVWGLLSSLEHNMIIIDHWSIRLRAVFRWRLEQHLLNFTIAQDLPGVVYNLGFTLEAPGVAQQHSCVLVDEAFVTESTIYPDGHHYCFHPSPLHNVHTSSFGCKALISIRALLLLLCCSKA